MAPKYIVELFIPYQNTRNMRFLHVPKTILKSKSDRAFSGIMEMHINLPHLWMLLSLNCNRTFLVELLELIQVLNYDV